MRPGLELKLGSLHTSGLPSYGQLVMRQRKIESSMTLGGRYKMAALPRIS